MSRQIGRGVQKQQTPKVLWRSLLLMQLEEEIENRCTAMDSTGDTLNPVHTEAGYILERQTGTYGLWGEDEGIDLARLPL